MRRSIVVVLVALLMVSATAASATHNKTERGRVSFEKVVKIFDDEGNSIDPQRSGWSILITRNNRLRAFSSIRGLEPGGVYTFWWVIIPSGGEFPQDAFVASGGGTVVGANGRAFARMSARTGDLSITGFIEPGAPTPFAESLDFDLRSAEVHVEVAYHGQAADAGSDLDVWLSDFWSGTACPAIGEQAATQPHCPVSFVAIHPGS